MSTILVNNITPYTGTTININGVLSATTYLNIPSSLFTGGTVSGYSEFLDGLSATTVSATTFYGDGSNLTGISNFTTITKSELDMLISISGLTQGKFYKITGVNTDLYGGTDIILLAVSTNAISKNGHGLFYNPKYNDYNVWSPSSLVQFTSQVGYFSLDEYITGDSGQIGKMIGLPGEETLSFISIQGEFSGGTTITGVNSSATAVVTNLTSANYNIGDKVIWGGKVWTNISGTSVSVINEIIMTGTNDYWQYMFFGSGVEFGSFTITNGVETFTSNGNTGCWNLAGDHGGYGCLFDTGYGYVHFNAGDVDGIALTGSYTTNIVSNISNGDNTPWSLGSSWEVVPYNEIDYVSTWDIIEYEYEHDNISLRKDAYNEVVSEFNTSIENWGWNSIKSMQWGGNVFMLTAKNAYLYNLVNFNGANIYNVNLEENSGFDSNQYWGVNTQINYININQNAYLVFNSIGNNNRYISNINIGNDSYINHITLANNDYNDIYFNGITLGNSGSESQVYLQDINLSSGSYFYGIELENSNGNDTYIENINLLNHAGIFNIKLDQGSYMYGINGYNYGRLRDIQIGQGAYIEYVDVYNGGDMFSIKLEGGANYGGWSNYSYIYGIIIGQDSYMHDIVLGLGSYIENIYMNNAYCRFKDIALGEKSRIYNITYHSNSGQFKYNKIGNNTSIHNIELYNSNFSYNTIGDNAVIQYMGLGENAYFDFNEIGSACNFGSISIGNNSEFGYLKVGLDAYVNSITLNDGIYVGDITIGEYLSLSNVTFDNDVYGKIIDRNNNDFPATYYVDNSSVIDLGDVYYAGIVTLKTQEANIAYINYAGTGFTNGDLIIDTTTNARGIITNNSVSVDTIIGEVITAADGNTNVFPFNLVNQRIERSSVVLTDTVETFTDNGNGILFGNYGGTGTINYSTGAGSVTFNSNPANGQAITINYQYATGGTLTINVTNPKTLTFNNSEVIDNYNGGYATVDTYTATTTAATISSIVNYPDNGSSNDINNGLYPVKFIPEYGLTVTFSGSPISTIGNNGIAMPATSFIANGSNDDYMVINKKNNTVTGKYYVQQIDAQNYN